MGKAMTDRPEMPRPYGWVIRGKAERGGAYSFRTTEPNEIDMMLFDDRRPSTAPHTPIPVALYQPGLPSAAAIANLRQDAERLEWMVANNARVGLAASGRGFWCELDDGRSVFGDTAREAIDNARNEK